MHPTVLPLDTRLATEAAQILREALSAIGDLTNGYPENELHRPPLEIDRDAQPILRKLDTIAAAAHAQPPR